MISWLKIKDYMKKRQKKIGLNIIAPYSNEQKFICSKDLLVNQVELDDVDRWKMADKTLRECIRIILLFI